MIALILLGGALAVQRVAAQPCSRYGPAVVTLTGTLMTQPDHPFIVKLDGAICLEPDSASWLYNDARAGVREIRLAVVGDSLLQRVQRLVGRRIVVTGQLFTAGTGRRQALVLLLLRDLRAA